MARFYDKTRPANDGTGCILWTAALQRNGYGKLGVAYRTVMAHRWIYEQHHGVTLDRLELVLHSCDRRNCVNLAHLRVGNHADNAADMDARGRRNPGGARGTRNRKAKLTDDIVRDCRARYAAGTATLTAMAAEYGTSINAMHQAVQGHTWRHVR